MSVGSAGPANDDQSIANSDRLLRRVHPNQLVIDNNADPLRWMPSSAAFVDATDGISVFLRSELDQIPRPESDVLLGYDMHSLVAVRAAMVRDRDRIDPPLGVARDPNPPDAPHACAPAHALIIGLVPGKPGLKRQRKPLARAANEFVVLRPPPK